MPQTQDGIRLIQINEPFAAHIFMRTRKGAMEDNLGLQIAQFRDRAIHCRKLAMVTASYRVQEELITLAQSYEQDAARLVDGASAILGWPTLIED